MMRSSSAGNFGIEAHRGDGSAIEDGVENCRRSVAARRERAGGHFVENDAEREKVGAGVEGFAAGLLGGHVGDRAHAPLPGW